MRCFDAMEEEIRKQGNEDVILVGPESVGCGGPKGCNGTDFFDSELGYFLNASHHANGLPPRISSCKVVTLSGFICLAVRLETNPTSLSQTTRGFPSTKVAMRASRRCTRSRAS